MKSNRKIAWEKFTPKHEIQNSFIQEEDDVVDYEEDKEEEDEEETNEPINFLNLQDLVGSRKIRTPFGFYSEDDDFSPYNMFECWIGHTNFRITKEDFDTLNNEINGIGCLKVISPYRFFIGIEKMFAFPLVRIQIQKELCQNLEFEDDLIDYSGDVDKTINMIISKVNDAIFSIRESEKWAIYIGDDGTIETIKNSDFEYDYEYNDKLKKLKSLKSGNIITYDSL